MTIDWLVVGITLLGVSALVGVFLTKTPGFGRYTTSVLLLILVLFITALLLATGKVDAALFGNVVFAVAGFAGGLITSKQGDS